MAFDINGNIKHFHDNNTELQSLLDDMKTVITDKGGTVDANAGLRAIPPAIGTIPTGGGSNGFVVFYDYDGSIVESYTTDEFLALRAMPENPTHAGLTSQGWNWSLSDAKEYVTDYGMLNIGQMYTTNNGSTRLHIRLGEGRLKPYLGLTGDSSGTAVSIDWGDGSTAESVTLDTNTVYTPHEYATSGDYTISISVTTGSITLTGDTTYYSNILRKSSTQNANTDKVYQNSLISIDIGNNVSIGQNAFYNCYSLQSINIPNTVTSIGQQAFYSCYSLTLITIPDSVTTIGSGVFYYCYALTSATIPNSVTSIGGTTFYSCYSLISITIPDTITTIGDHTFYYCYSLKSVTIPNGVTGIGRGLFLYCSSLTTITLPNTITSIGQQAFQYCYSLQSITLPDTVTSIGQQAFANCYALTSIDIPDGVTTIENQAFQYCYALQSITLPDTITSIEYWTFQYCYSLTSITVPNGVTSIGDNAFHYCYSLTNVNLPNTVISIGNGVFYYCYSLQSITIPNSVTSIGSGAFYSCYSLKSVTILNGVTTIGGNAFSSCYSLQSITIPDSVTTIGQGTFYYCYALASITIHDGVTEIGNNAFNNCQGLGSVKFESTTPPTVPNSNAWGSVPTDCTMLVPINTYSAYTTATNYPSSLTYTYLVYGTYASGTTLPSTTTDNYMLIWYASIADAIAQTNPITTGNGNETYARCLVDTSVTRSIDFDNNTSTLSGDPSTHPIYTNIKRCTVQNDGTITSYYGDANYVEDGSIGQVMVYIPKFYYKVNITDKQLVDSTKPEYGYDIHKASYSVSNIKYQGYKLHPAFINADGDEVDYVLCSAFEGSTYDTSASAYNTNDAQTVDFTATTGDLLASIGYVDSSGTTVHVKPASGLTQQLTRPNSMTIAKNRGTGWYALTFKLTSAIQMLITVEYGCNSQVNIADGVVGINDNSSYNCASYVGSTVGNTTGRAASTINEINGTETTNTSATTTSVNWRGIENMWGNIWKWVDGINIYGNGSQRGGVPYVCTDMNFSDTNTANYESVGFTVANTDGYVKYFGWGSDNYDWVFMPSTAGSGDASASTTVGDYFYKTANLNGYRVARLGGHWANSSIAGVFFWCVYYDASYRYRYIGARLMYIPS